jgi:hypothetical protein
MSTDGSGDRSAGDPSPTALFLARETRVRDGPGDRRVRLRPSASRRPLAGHADRGPRAVLRSGRRPPLAHRASAARGPATRASCSNRRRSGGVQRRGSGVRGRRERRPRWLPPGATGATRGVFPRVHRCPHGPSARLLRPTLLDGPASFGRANPSGPGTEAAAPPPDRSAREGAPRLRRGRRRIRGHDGRLPLRSAAGRDGLRPEALRRAVCTRDGIVDAALTPAFGRAGHSLCPRWPEPRDFLRSARIRRQVPAAPALALQHVAASVAAASEAAGARDGIVEAIHARVDAGRTR